MSLTNLERKDYIEEIDMLWDYITSLINTYGNETNEGKTLYVYDKEMTMSLKYSLTSEADLENKCIRLTTKLED